MAAIRKQDGDSGIYKKNKNVVSKTSKQEQELVNDWAKTENSCIIKNQQTVYAWPSALFEEMNYVLQNLRVIYSGVLAGELLRDKFIPAHALALSNLISTTVKKVSLSKEQAIAYLQKKDFILNTSEKGWVLATYSGFSIGWMNILQNRINNYYPKELRIFKEKE